MMCDAFIALHISEGWGVERGVVIPKDKEKDVVTDL